MGKSLKQLPLVEFRPDMLVCLVLELKGEWAEAASRGFDVLVGLLLRIRMKGEQPRPTTSHTMRLINKSKRRLHRRAANGSSRKTHLCTLMHTWKQKNSDQI